MYVPEGMFSNSIIVITDPCDVSFYMYLWKSLNLFD